MTEYFIFSDGSFDPRTKTGLAGVLILSKLDASEPIQLKTFKNTSCTRLELESILWALKTVQTKAKPIIHLYTDCKTAVDLPGRRKNLESKQFRSQKTGILLSNADLYQEFFKLCDALKPNLIWTKGHRSQHDQDQIQRHFSSVDKATRQALRQEING